ncbi:MAG: hypothetical protein GY947_20665 [Rhodobacteraceae bacterium]|nr:hypothetical protein [Paracoccaceae bacterium]
MSEQPDVNPTPPGPAHVLLSTSEKQKTFPQALIDALELAGAECAGALEELAESKVKIDVSATSLVPAEEPIDFAGHILKYRVYSETDEWAFIIALSQNVLYDYLELVLGSEDRGHVFVGTRVPTEVDTAVGQSLAERFAKLLCEALAASDELDFESFCCEQLIEDPEQPALVGETYRAEFAVTLFGSESDFLVAFPADKFETLADADIVAHLPAPAAANEAWSSHMSSEARRANVQLTAILSGGHATLDSLSRLTPGMVLPLQATPNSTVDLECNSVPLMRCKFGQSDGNYTLSVESFIRPSDRSTERELAVALGMLESA